MKIFNWVHRKFYHQKGEVGQDAAKNEVAGNGRDKVALLENAALDGAFDGWKEGILAIGTFGLDPALFKDLVPEDDDMYLCEIIPKELLVEDEEYDHGSGDREREMEFPLMLKACKHGFFGDQQKDDHDHQPQCDEACKPNDYNDDEDDLDSDQVKKERKAGERITLADLFWADSEKNLLKNKIKLGDYDKDHVKEVGYDHDIETNMSKNDDRVGLISKKKLTKGDPARPIKKINRLVRKMLKKKIHPDVENEKEVACRKTMRILGSIKNEY